jgi:hypothetical protein
MVAMPRYGLVVAGAAERLFRPYSHHCQAVTIGHGSNSLTANAFNDLFVSALDLKDAGKITHFAMIHSDVVPENPLWLDELYEEMDSSGAMLASAVIAIKEDRPDVRVSTAIGTRSDPWKPCRTLYLRDRENLPTTFGRDELKLTNDEVLLVNTGLWLTDLTHPAWDDFPGFTVTSRIVTVDGKRLAQCRPEDWEMSRHLDRHNARYVATWRPRVGHEGVKTWWNR